MPSFRPVLLAAALLIVALPSALPLPAATPVATVEAAPLVPFDQLDSKPKVRTQVPPQFPWGLKGKFSEARVLVEFTVTVKGTVADAKIVEAPAREFELATLDAVQRWRFDPGKKDGKPVATRMAVPLGFRNGDAPIAPQRRPANFATKPTPEVLADAVPFQSLEKKPRVIRQVPPVYPFALKSGGRAGRVVLQIIVGAAGDVEAAWPAEVDEPGFVPAAIDAVCQWKFEPGTKNGSPVRTLMQVPIGFKLDN